MWFHVFSPKLGNSGVEIIRFFWQSSPVHLPNRFKDFFGAESLFLGLDFALQFHDPHWDGCQIVLGPSRFSSSDIPQVLIEKTPVEAEKSQFLCGLGVNQPDDLQMISFLLIISDLCSSHFLSIFLEAFVTFWPFALLNEAFLSHNSYHLKTRHDQTAQTTGFTFDHGWDV